jgi:hypothetical protein
VGFGHGSVLAGERVDPRSPRTRPFGVGRSITPDLPGGSHASLSPSHPRGPVQGRHGPASLAHATRPCAERTT